MLFGTDAGLDAAPSILIFAPAIRHNSCRIFWRIWGRWCKSNIVFSIVGYPSDVEEIYFGEHGVLSGTPTCTTIVDMTTSEPSLAQTIAEKAAEKAINSLDAPVSGGDIGAKEGKLAIMVGGEAAVFERMKPLFAAVGRTQVHVGPNGAGQVTKACNQLILCAFIEAAAEAARLASASGVDFGKSPESV